MKKASRKTTTEIVRYTFTEEEIAEILREHIGIPKNADYDCYFDIGQCFRSAEITVTYVQGDLEAE